jgi:tetratricopeptide (TPR) repeat protein
VQLADVYLSLGNFERARLLSEQLIAARPDDPSHVQRLGRAMEGLGFADGEREARSRAHRLTSAGELGDFAAVKAPPAMLVEDVSEADVSATPASWAMPSTSSAEPIVTPPESFIADEDERGEAGGRGAAASGSPPRMAPGPATAETGSPERDVFEIDLSGELDDLLSAAAAPAREAAPAAQEHPGGLEGFFEDLREERGRTLEGVSAAMAYDLASEHFNRGEVDDAAACLRTAARDPLFRFRAASMLARIARDERRYGEAVEWLERAAEAPAPSNEASHGLLYELGDLLASSQEDARALAVFIELQAAAPGYRDVADRIATLSRRQAGLAGPEKGNP